MNNKAMIDGEQQYSELFSRYYMNHEAQRLAVCKKRTTNEEFEVFSEAVLTRVLKQQDKYAIRLCDQNNPDDSIWVSNYGEVPKERRKYIQPLGESITY